MRGVGKFRKLLLGFVTSILLVGQLLTGNVSAYDPSLGCINAMLSVDDPLESSIFTISVECSQQISLVDSDNPSVNIAGITLNGIHPTRVDVIDSKLNLTFNYSDFSVGDAINLINRSLNIDAGVLMDGDGLVNSPIVLNASNIIDKVSPSANADSYEIHGSSLSVNAAKGLLANDFEYESLISEIVIDSPPSFGEVDIKSDGSFTYTNVGLGDDEFYYHSIDGAGNVGNSVSVKIVDAAPEIKAKFYNNNSVDSIYAKLGDLLRLDFSVSEESVIDEIKICGNLIPNYSNIGAGIFRAEYVTSISDSEGWCLPWIKVHDVSNKESTYQGSDAGLYLDNTKPAIDLSRGNNVSVGIYEGFDYLSELSAYDATPEGVFIGELPVEVTGSVDFDHVGVYTLSFRAVDRAGNVTVEQQVYHIYDSVNDIYSEFADELFSYGIVNNLADINTDNYGGFRNLYFEKIINSKKIGRIEFKGSIDIASFEDLFQEFIKTLPIRFIANNFGSIGMNLSDIEDSSMMMGGGAEIKFYNLNEVGYSNGSKQKDIISNILTYDDEGVLVGGDGILSFGDFNGCGSNFSDCYTFSMVVSHFSTYVIKSDSLAPSVTLNKLKNYQIGETIRFSGKIDDSDAKLTIAIDGRQFIIPKTNINNGEWFFEISSDILGTGNHSAIVSAVDFGNNKSFESDKFNIIKKATDEGQNNQVFVNGILTQPASIISDNSVSILGDRIKGRTKSTAIVLKSDFGLDKNEIGLIAIVLILGVAILVVDRRLS